MILILIVAIIAYKIKTYKSLVKWILALHIPFIILTTMASSDGGVAFASGIVTMGISFVVGYFVHSHAKKKREASAQKIQSIEAQASEIKE